MKYSRSAIFFSTLLIAGLVSCNHGGGTDGNDSPVVDAGVDQVVRSGQKVIISGSDTDDPDGVVRQHTWTQVSGRPVVLLNARSRAPVTQSVVNPNNPTVTFQVPELFEPETFVFELTATDDDGASSTDSISIFAFPPTDPNTHLKLFDTPTSFKVVAGTVNPALPPMDMALPADFTLQAELDITYTDEQETFPSPVVTIDITGRSATWQDPEAVPVPRTGTWLLSEGTGGEDCDAYNNPRYTFDIPAIRQDDLPFINGSRIDNVTATVRVSLNSVSTVDTFLCILNDTGDVLLSGKGVAAGTDAIFEFPLDVLQDDNDADTADETLAQAQEYYDLIDPDKEKETLAEWLGTVDFANSVTPGTVMSASYLNGFDLGFGRKMFVNRKDSGEVYTYVVNYPDLFTLQNGLNTLATVVMEFSPPPGEQAVTVNGHCDNCYTKFFTYAPDEVSGEQLRVASFDFDGRGERFLPATCTTCHGGVPLHMIAESKGPGDVGGKFMPWDIQTLYFDDDEFQSRARITQPTQQQLDAFRFFNETVLLTNPTVVTRDLIHGWYGDIGNENPSLPAAAAFNGGFIDPDWIPESQGGPAGTPDDAGDLYVNTIGPTCRACHSQLAETGLTTLTFESYENLQANADKIAEEAFDEGTMPMARLTADNFWTDTTVGSEALASHLGIDTDLRSPGMPIARINGTEVPENIPDAPRNVPVRLSANPCGNLRTCKPSLFAATANWTLSAPAGSSAVLVGDDTKDPAFVPDKPGDYIAELTVTSFNDVDSEPAAITVTVIDLIPDAVDDAASAKQETATDIDVLANDRSDGSLGDEPTTLSLPSGTTAESGTVTVDDNGTASDPSDDSITYTSSAGFSGTDSFDYTITDIDGQFSTATVTVTVTELPSAVDDPVSTLADNAVNIPVLDNDTLGVTPTTLSLIGAGPAHGMASINDNGTPGDPGDDSIDYTPDAFFTSPTPDAFIYRITDSNGDASDGIVSVTVNPQAPFSKINTIWSSRGCTGCHGISGGLTLSGAKNDNYAAIVPGRVTVSTDQATAAGSLILCKPLNSCTHGSSTSPVQIFSNTSDVDYQAILRWIREGAQNN